MPGEVIAIWMIFALINVIYVAIAGTDFGEPKQKRRRKDAWIQKSTQE